MAGIDRTTGDKLLKEVYGPPIRDQINRATVGLDLIPLNKDEKVEGRNYIIPVIKAKHHGVTSRSGASKTVNKLPTAQRQSYEVSTWAMKYHYGRIEVDGPLMRSSKTDKGSFARALDIEMKGLATAAIQDLNRQLYGDGTNALCVVTTGHNNDATVTVDTTKFLDVGKSICILTHDGGTAITADADVTVASITDDNNFEASTAVTTTATTHAIFSERDASSGSTPYRNAMTGLKAICFDGNITNMGTQYVGSINRSTAGNEFWNANRLHNSGTLRPWSPGLMQQAVQASRKSKFGGTMPKIALTNGDIWATIGNQLVADKRFRGEVMTLDSGWEYLLHSGVKIFWDKDSTDDEIFVLDTDHIFFLTQTDWEWADEDGSILKWVQDYDSYQAFMLSDRELASDLCAAQTLLQDIDVSLS